MKQLSNEEVQRESYKVLCHIHDFCVSHEIRYSLAYGTLIGAIRHNGFIPWDDDIDILMPRPDYERFCTIYEDSKSFKLFSLLRGNNVETYSRVCDMKRTIVKNRIPWTKDDTGIWVDIFPVDGYPEDSSVAEKHVKLIRKIFMENYYKRSLLTLFPSKDEKFSLKMFVLHVLRHFCQKNAAVNNSELQTELIKVYDFEHCKRGALLAFMSYKVPMLFHQTDFDNMSLHKFEDREFYIVNDYDSALRSLYGDYMKLPPVEQRQPRKTNRIFWK